MSRLIHKYEESLAGAKAVVVKDGAPLTNRIAGSYGSFEYLPKGQYVVLTGDYWYDGEYTNYLLTTNGWFVVADTYAGTDTYWQVTKGAFRLPNITQAQAQSLVDKIVQNNITIVENNLVCARYANKFTKAQQQQIRDLQARAENRKNALVEDGLCEVTTSYPKGFADLSGYLDALMKNEGVGVITWATVVFTAIVVAGASVAAYYAYRIMYEDSAEDVQYSKELMRVLKSKLTDEEYEQLKKETQGIVTKSKIRQLAGGAWDALKIGAAIFLGAWVVRKINQQ